MKIEEYEMNMQSESVRIRQDELDREIEAIRAERLLNAVAPPHPTLPSRARARIGRRLISLGTALVGQSQPAPAAVHQNRPA
jgi:hypothetical protein